jgi:hypothetical protein
MRRQFILAFTAILVACGDSGGHVAEPSSSSGGSASGGMTAPASCDLATGLYLTTLVQQSGTCGPQDGGLVNLARPNPAIGTFGSACQGNCTRSANGCTFECDFSCPADPTGVEQVEITQFGAKPPVMSFITTMTWDPSLMRADGIWTIRRRFGNMEVCSGTYTVSLVRS